jgi:hypothetical protein
MQTDPSLGGNQGQVLLPPTAGIFDGRGFFNVLRFFKAERGRGKGEVKI